jgi:5,10-methylenetetrahydromethanopterin reductase
MHDRGVEFWTLRLMLPGMAVRWARQAEDDGWDGIAVGDSQNIAADPYGELTLAASVTSRIALGTAVTNPVTRHPAVTASAIATVQGESGGRAVLGIGRGDSALAHLGLSPAPVAVFARYVDRVQGYLRGDDVGFDVETDGARRVRSSDALGMAAGPGASRLEWLPADLPKVPVDVYASGPNVIAVASRLADRVTFAVGSDPVRVRWAVEVARSARIGAGLDPDGQPMGVFLPVVVHPDRVKARALAAGGVASFARFSVMHGSVTGPLDGEQRHALEAIHAAYDMTKHFAHGSSQSAAVTDDVIDTFGVAGPPAYCVERLLALIELGIRRIVIQAGIAGPFPDEMRTSRRLLVDEVLPALR